MPARLRLALLPLASLAAALTAAALPADGAARTGARALAADTVARDTVGREPAGAASQPAPDAHAGHGGHAAHAAPRALTPAARAQLARARAATAALATPEAARAAGFRPMFGHVPLQGEHWVRVDRVLADSFDLERPSVLMFSPVQGTPTLVGVAYAFLRDAAAPLPAGFDGAADAWHAHERLAPTPGRHVVMMHAWFDDAPEGAFARYNPRLPYLATGLRPPTATVLAHPTAGVQARRLGLALATASTPPLLFQLLDRQGGEPLRARTAPARDSLQALVPRLVAAERAGDAAGRERLAGAAIRHAEALVDSYRSAFPERPLAGRLVDRTVDEFMGRGHGIEEELGALLQGMGMGRMRAGGATTGGTGAP